jgi:hypothetical protein
MGEVCPSCQPFPKPAFSLSNHPTPSNGTLCLRKQMSLDVTLSAVRPTEVFSANITHNLNRMAKEAGIYELLWRPDEIGVTKAAQLIDQLRAGIALMKADPKRFEALNPSNGWGSYNDFLPWLETYLSACEENPDADVSVSR